MNSEANLPALAVHVSDPFLPPIEEFIELIRGIWARRQLTNQGPLVIELEQQLQIALGIQPLHLVTNGAIGLHLAIKALGIGGEVITTPFSYVATTSCPMWEGLQVVFADIDPDTLTIDPQAVEAAITPRTEAILATHVYGNPCDVEEIGRIAKRHNLAVIYDAAHAFAVRYQGRSILEWGDLSMVSLHATKLFHTAEGGLIAGANQAALERVEWMRRFGHSGENAYFGIGTNGKMTELQAALGLCLVKRIDQLIAERRRVCLTYDALLFAQTCGLEKPRIRENTEFNYAYYPVLFPCEAALMATNHLLQSENIFARRYFFPSLDSLFGGSKTNATPISANIAARVLCLPLSSQLSSSIAERVATLVRTSVSRRS